MAAAGADITPWDPGNVAEGQLLKDSVYAELLNKSRVDLYKNLQLDDLWPHLRELQVLTRIQETAIKYNRPRPDVVMELLDLIDRGPLWKYHGLMRAITLTNQSYLISKEGSNLSVYSDPTPVEKAATATSALPLWDKSNVEQGQLVCHSHYAELLNKSRVSLSKHLKLDGIWRQLWKMQVLSETEEKILKYNKAEPEAVAALLDFIECGPQWRYHALIRAMALTGQAALIPEDEVDKRVYADVEEQVPPLHARQALPLLPPKDTAYNSASDRSFCSKTTLETDTSSCEPEGVRKSPLLSQVMKRRVQRLRSFDLDAAVYPEDAAQDDTRYYTPDRRPPLPPDLIRVIRKHCTYCEKYLMRSHLFAFEGDAGNDTIDISQIFINVTPSMKDGHIMAVPIEESKILEPIGDSLPPRIIKVQAQPGDGKTSFARHAVYRWSIEFMKQKLDQNGYLKESPKWTTMVFIRARDVKTTVEAAIREQLGCTGKDQDMLMAHVKQGEGVAVFIEALDELRDPVALAKIKDYVHACQRGGGPTILITCRTDVCNIDAKEFDRLLTLKGFSEEQGLEYVKLYTEKYEHPKLEPLGPSPVLTYVMNHKEEMKSILSNPLRLNIFCSLAVRGELDLDDKEGFNIPKLFIPLERHLLRRGDVEVSEEQSQSFYKLCMHLLVEDLQEFPGTLLEEFDIVESYHVFLKKSDKRNSSGELVPYYSFSHEMIIEFFASRYIYTLNTKERMSFLLAICRDPYLRNVQKIVLQLLLHEGKTQDKLIQTVIRSMLILQFDEAKLTWNKTAYKLMHLRNQIENNASLSDILHSKSFEIKNASSICKSINSAFNKHAEVMRATKWFQCLKENGTIDHVVDCLQSFPPRLRDSLMQNTMLQLLPGEYEDEKRIKKYVYPVSGLRWAEVTKTPSQHHQVKARSCADAAEALLHHRKRYPSSVFEKLEINMDYCSGLWGETADNSWSELEWETVLDAASGRFPRHTLSIQVHEATKLTDLLACLPSHVLQLSPCKKIEIRGGTAYFGDLLTGVSRCRLQGLELEVKDVHIVSRGALETYQSEINDKAVDKHTWNAVLQDWPTDQLIVTAPDKCPVTGLLSYLLEHAAHLSHCEQIVVKGGRAQLKDLATCVSSCSQGKLNVKLQDTYILLPHSHTTPDNLRVELKGCSKQYVWLSVPAKTPVTGLLLGLSDHAVHLSQCEEVIVEGGTGKLGDLLTCAARCAQEGIKLDLQKTHIVLPEGIITQESNSSPNVGDVKEVDFKKWTHDQMLVSLHETSTLSGLLSCLLEHAVHLSLCEAILVEGGTGELGDLVTLFSKCSLAGLNLKLQNTHIALPEGIMPLQGAQNKTAAMKETLQVHIDNWTKEQMLISLADRIKVTSLLSHLLEHAVHLSQCEEIRVAGGTAHLGHLVTCVSSCRQGKLNVKLQDTHVMLPHTWTIRQEPDKLQVELKNWSKQQMWISVPDTSSVAGLLLCLSQQAAHLSLEDKIIVEGGIAHLENLLTSVPRCTLAQLKLELWDTQLVLPDGLPFHAQRYRTTALQHNLLVKLGIWTNQQIWVSVPATCTAPVTGLLTCLADHAADLSLVEKIIVEGGRAELKNLETGVLRCAQVDLPLMLYDTQIVLPQGLTNTEDTLYQLTMSSTLQNVSHSAHWVEEIGDFQPCQAKMLCKSDTFVCGGGKRMAEVWLCGAELHVHIWCPSDAGEALRKLALKNSNLDIKRLHVHTNYYNDIWGHPNEDCWSQEAWDRLLQVQSNGRLGEMWIFVDETTPLTGLLSGLLDNATQLSQCKITVPYGSVSIEDLAESASRCQDLGVDLTLSSVRVVVSEKLIQKNDTLQEMIDSCQLVCSEANWVREDGEYISQSNLLSLVSPRMFHYDVGTGRGAEVRSKNAELYVYSWCLADASDALAQHTSMVPVCCKVLHIHTNHYRDTHGQPDDSSCSNEVWDNLIQAMPKRGLQDLWIFVDEATSLTGLLSSIRLLSQCAITVPYGTVKLEDLVNCPWCERKEIKLTLSSPHIVLSDRLRVDKDALQLMVNVSEMVCCEPNWVTESGEYISQSGLRGLCRGSIKRSRAGQTWHCSLL